MTVYVVMAYDREQGLVDWTLRVFDNEQAAHLYRESLPLRDRSVKNGAGWDRVEVFDAELETLTL